jgi:glycosyltransferase involved in cell wall biosynthesis
VLISVVVCTYNPTDQLLTRVLDAILAQDFNNAEWELLLVDNNSNPPVSERHSIMDRNIRVVTESEQGLSKARECGLRNTRGSIIVFVDDDNVLASDYLRAVSAVFTNPKIAVVSGAIEPEYEIQPDPWFIPFESMLAIRRFNTEWSHLTNTPLFNSYFAIGAGMAVRREVIEDYYRSITEGGVYLPGRVGSDLSSSEDIDLDFFAISKGYLIGSVGSLKLRHVIPAARTTPDYITRLAIASTRSAAELNAKWSRTFNGDVIGLFSTSRRQVRVKRFLSGLLRFNPKFRVRYYINKTLEDLLDERR